MTASKVKIKTQKKEIERLIIEGQSGNTQARNKVIELHLNLIQYICQDEDMVQIAVERVLKYFNSYKVEIQDFKNWVAVLSKNVKTNYKNDDFKQSNRFPTFTDRLFYTGQEFDTDYYAQTEAPTFQEENEQEYKMEVIKEIVDKKLKPSQKRIFNLYYFEGLIHQEIAEFLSINVGTSKSQLFRAKERIEEVYNTITH